MGRELPIFTPTAGPAGHGAGHAYQPLTIAMGGSVDASGLRGPDKARHPDWIKARMPSGANYAELKDLVRGQTLNTVCEEARCPNIGECWEQRTATVMILGDTCTRACGFCAVKTGRPDWEDADEPRRVAEAVAVMGLEHVVVTSVCRDDMADGGAGVFAATIRELRRLSPDTGVEVLIPDYLGADLRTVMEAGPGHPQPQRRDRRAAPEAGPQAGPLRPLAAGPRGRQVDGSRAGRSSGHGAHQVEHHGRPGRDGARSSRRPSATCAPSTATSSPWASTCARRLPTCPSSATSTPTSSPR